MGGRGASSGISKAGNKYGSQYHSLFTVGNVKFVSKNSRDSETLMETMTRGRVYAHVEGDKIKSIVYFDNENKRSKQIDLDHAHAGTVPHAHRGYFHNEGNPVKKFSNLSPDEKEMVDRVTKLWENSRRGK